LNGPGTEAERFRPFFAARRQRAARIATIRAFGGAVEYFS
jgi:hypothetical protein